MEDSIKKIKYYSRIWYVMSRNAFMVMLSNKGAFFIFLTGKIIRFTFFVMFLFFFVQGVGGVVGYDTTQMLFIFLTFNLIDVIGQFLFREVYRFRSLLVSGDFDLILAKPTNALFRVLMGGTDIIDLVTIPPLLLAVIYVGAKLNPTPADVALYILLIINGLVIATAFHIGVIAMGILTMEIDHSIMIFRDMLNLGRFPIEIYKQPLRAILTFLIPVGIMITLPARMIMGMATPVGVAMSFIVAALSIFIALKFWNRALRSYTSASS
jgi:ABC-2 type transport system permease protein